MAEVLTADEDRLPWLEAVEDEDEKQGPSAAKLIGALLVGLAAIAAVIYALFSLGNSDAARYAEGEAPLIAAEGGDYKEKPAEAGGMKVEGAGDTAFAASEGADPAGKINLDAIPEAPVKGARGIAPAKQLETKAGPRSAQSTVTNQPVATPAQAAEAPAVGGPAVQLGSFSSDAAAQSAWKSMSGRFASLKPLTNSVVSATVNGKTVHRLRANVASRAEANTLCGKLKVAGESCAVVN